MNINFKDNLIEKFKFIFYYIISILLIFLFSSNLFAQDSQSERIYQSVLKATFTMEKIEAGKLFLKTNECKEGKWISKILKDSHYWNREAGIYFAGECKNQNLDKEICKLFLEDNMTRSTVRGLIKKDPNRYAKILISIYNKDIFRPTKEDLFSLYQMTNDADTSTFLQDIIQDLNSPDRAFAFKTLMKCSKKPGNTFFRSYLNDPELRKYSLNWIVETGNSSDIELFRTILGNPKSNMEELATACLAIQKWGNKTEKKNTYFRFLKEDTQSLLPSAFLIFKDLQDDDIFREVSRLSRIGKNQSIRTEAVLQLKNYSGQNKYPYIILFLQEDYQSQSQQNMGDVIATVITFGIHGIFQGLEEKSRKNKFDSFKSDLIQLLQKETGEKISDVVEWKDWAKKKKLLPISILYE